MQLFLYRNLKSEADNSLHTGRTLNAWKIFKVEFFTPKERKSLYENMYGIEWFLGLTEKLHYLKYVTFYLKLTQ
jgi:hypothetical protein